MRRLLPWLIAAAILIGGIIYYLSPGPKPAASATPSVQVTTLSLKPGTLPATFDAYGSVVAGPGAEQTITLQASGVATSIPLVPGQRVAQGDTLATVTSEPTGVATLQNAINALRATRANHAHVAALLASHLATNADLAVANQAVRDAQTTLAALRASGTGETRTIKAPFTGIVTRINALPGTLQPAGTALLQIVNPNALVAMAGIPPAQMPRTTAGDTAKITLLNSGKILDGQVLQTSEVSDPQTGLGTATLSLSGASVLGEPIAAAITTGTLQGYVVPRDSIQTDEKGDYAFQIDAKNIAHRVTVQILGTLGQQTIIAPSLNPAQPYVTTGAYQLSDGTAVRTATPGGAAN